MAFLDAFRRRRGLDAITGINGGSLQDQLEDPKPNPFAGPSVRPQQPQPVNPTMADQYMATARPVEESVSQTRPRSTNPFLDRFNRATPPVELEQTGPNKFVVPESTYDPGRPQRIVEPADEVTKSSDYIRQIQDKPLSFRDKAGLVAQNLATNLGAQPLATRRQRDLAKAGEGLQRDLAVQGQQYKSQALQSAMDKREADILNAQSRILQGDKRLDETKRRNDAYISHINDLPKEKQAEAARKMYMAGIADGDPEFKSTLAKRMGVTEELPDTDKGSIQVDAAGNYIVIHPRTGGTTPVTETGPPQLLTPGQPPVKKPVGSFKATQEKKRDERARLGRVAAMDRAIVMAKAQGARLGDPDTYKGLADDADEDAKAAEAQATEAGPRRAAPYLAEAGRAKQRATRLRELENKARGGQSPEGTMQSAPKRVFNDKAFRSKFQEKHGRQPTEAEIAPYRNAQ